MTKSNLLSGLIEVCNNFKSFFTPKDIDDYLSLIQSKLEEAVKSLSLKLQNDTLQELLENNLPVIQPHLDHENGQFFSLTVLCQAQEKFSLNDFIFNLFRYELIPGGNLHPSGFHNLTFNVPSFSKQLYIAHLVFMTRNERLFDLIESNLLFFLQFLERGIKNPHYAQAFLNRQISIPDQKGNLVHNSIVKVISKKPFCSDVLLSEMSLFMVLSTDIFRKHRPSKYLARIICSLAHLRKLNRELPKLSDTKPKIHLRFIPMSLKFTFGEKKTFGLCMIVSHLGEYQLFNDGCVLQAVKTYYPEAQLVKGSYLRYQHPQDESFALYLELENKKGEAFSLDQIKYLKRNLLRGLEASIEEVVPSVFMISNEEEIMKNIIILRNELESIDDLTQVMIFFEGQTLKHLTFLIILVRILENGRGSISELLQDQEGRVELVYERTRIVSLGNDEITKEANVFRLHLKKSIAFVRTDSSVNLHQARQHVVEFLKEKLGPIRDYTGSLIDLQNTLFRQFKEKFRDVGSKYPNILEDFFYTIGPADVKITLPLSSIETLFELFLELMEVIEYDSHKYIIKKYEIDDFAFAFLCIRSSIFDQLGEKIRIREEFYPSLISNKVQFKGHTCIGYIYRSEEEAKRIAFFQQLYSMIFNCIKEEQSDQTLRLGTQTFPTSLDPRLTLLPTTNYIFKLLFDGLMRLDAEGNPVCAIAESYTLSQDKKVYTFNLRESYWNSGDPVTAHDFAYSWKKILSPSFRTPFSYLFYPIKNAKKAKNGVMSLDDVGVFAEDPRTLVVELEYPVLNFLRLITLSVFFPVNQIVDRLHPDWPYRTSNEYICNGPFILEKLNLGEELQLVKNEGYWDCQNVHLRGVSIHFNSIDTIFQQYQKGEIDWIGAPFTPWENRYNTCVGEKNAFSSSSLNWILLNAESGPLKSKKFRQALLYCLNLEELVKEIPVPAQLANSPLPSIYSQLNPRTICQDRENARRLFNEALEELGLSDKSKIKLTLTHGVYMFEVREKFLEKMQQQFHEILGIDLQVEILPWNVAYKKNLEGSLQLLFMGWKFLIDDPFFFLDSVESDEQYHLYHWSHQEYRNLLQKAREEEDPTKRADLILQLEQILLSEVPIIPLYSIEEHYLKNKRLEGVISDNRIGAVDFKTAYFKSVKPDFEKFVKYL